MLAETGDGPFSREGWLFELKYDGYRLLAATGEAAGEGAVPRPGGGRRVRLAYRSGRDATAVFPELARALAALPYPSLVLDGEVVVLDDDARPSFGRLQQRALLSRRADVERATVEHPVVFQVFDLPAFAGFDLRPLPLARRKQLLRRVLPAAGPLRFCDHVEARGEELWAAARAQGLEGLLAKRADSPYRAGRSPDWLKLRAVATADLVVVGFTAPKGSAPGLGALHLGWLDAGRLVYAGRAGSGLSDPQRRDLRRRLDESARPDPPLAPPAAGEPEPPQGAEHTWVEPRLVAEVRYTEVTAAGVLRHPVFVRLRDDKPPGECLRPGAGHAEEPPETAAEERDDEREPPPKRPPLSNLDKVFWPAGEGGGPYTKGDLLAWYETAAEHLLPYLADRPLVLDRYPDGIAGKSFFQKNAPDHVPGWVRTEAVWSEDGGAATRSFACDDLPTLLYLVNLGAIPLHVGAARFAAPQHPDWSILDLDAKDAPFAAAVEVARAARRLTARAGLPAYVKTSGASGLHVLIPLGARVTHEQSRQLAEVLARLLATELPELASVARLPRARRGKVYLDYLQNGYGKLLVAPYSARPLPGAPVSMPLAWEELTPQLDPRDFTLATAPRRLAEWDGDPMRPVLDEAPDLAGALSRLVETLE
jgi:bifunctional non-homologous end joining protein LigD